MRRSELLGIRWQDVELEEGKIRVRQSLVRKTGKGLKFKKPKTNSSVRAIEISDKVVELLKKIKKEQNEDQLFLGPDYDDEYNLVFCKQDGTPFGPDVASARVRKIAKKADLEGFGLHSLRHTHATLLLKADVHPKVVQERLGHSSINQTLDTYSHVIPTMQQESVEKFDKLMGEN
jgi:integrase